MQTAADFFDRYKLRFKLSSHPSNSGKEIPLCISKVQRPELSLEGPSEDGKLSTLVIFGKAELDDLLALTNNQRMRWLQKTLTKKISIVILAEKLNSIQELVKVCQQQKILLLFSQLTAEKLLVELSVLVAQDCCPCRWCHGTLVEVYGIGIMIEGEAGIGKSETALELVARGHRLIADDRIFIQKKSGNKLFGKGAELSRHLLEMRGIGIVNVNHLYGAGCVRNEVMIGLVVCFEKWENHHWDDAAGLQEQFKELIGIHLPFYTLPVKPGRNLALLTEAIALNYRAKSMGYHAAQELQFKLSQEIAKQK